MTFPHEIPDVSADELNELAALLASPSLWEDPIAGLDDRILQEVSAEVVARPRMPSAPGRSDRRYPWPIGAVAALFLLLGVGIGFLAQGGDDAEVVALAGTELAPEASATAELDETPQGLRVLLTVSKLPAAEDGTYYQGWLRNDEGDAVTIGTFHLRGGDGEVELWAGVLGDAYPIITVTLQQEGEGSESSGVVVLRGRLED